jgi:hypothetical protein
MDTETLDRLFLEWSQFTKARTGKEIALFDALTRLMEQPTMNPISMTPEQRTELWAAHNQARTALSKANPPENGDT